MKPKQVKLTAAVQLRAAAAKKRPTFAVAVYNGRPFRPESSYRDAPIVIALAGVTVARDNLPVLLDHNQAADSILGQTTRVVVSQSAIEVDGAFVGAELTGSAAARVLALARDGFEFQASVGMELGKVKYVAKGESTKVNGRQVAGPVYVAEVSTLREISFVSIGADGDANVRIAAARQKASRAMDFHEWLKARGFDPADLAEAQRDTLLKAYQAEQAAELTASGGEVDPMAPVKLARERRTKLRTSIERATVRFPARLRDVEALAGCAVAEDWTPERFELEIYRTVEHGYAPDNQLTAGASRNSAEVIECGLLRLVAGDAIARKAHGDQVMNASERVRVRGFDSLAEQILRARGEELPRTAEAAIKAAMRPALTASAGPSTMDLGQALANTARRYLSEVQLSAAQTWRAVSAVRSSRDFRPHHEVAGVLNEGFALLAPGGEVLHASASDTMFERQLKTFARKLTLDRTTLINDDIGVISTFVRAVYGEWNRLLNDRCWLALLGAVGTAHFDATNEISGGDTVLSAPAIAEAVQLLRDRKNPAGSPLDIVPHTLVVSSALEMQARALLRSSQLERSQATDDQEPRGNPIAELGLQLVVESRIGGTFHANSDDRQWYITASPMSQTPAIYASFLNGAEVPQVQQIQETATHLGLTILAFGDTEFSIADGRGIVRSAGA